MPGLVNEDMKIERLYLYPIKSIRGIELDSTTVTKYGFANDRCFMVLKATKSDDGSTTYENTAIAKDNNMCRFFPSFDSSDRQSFTVTYKPVDGSADKTISIPLEPETDDLELVDVIMHKSPTQAFLMSKEINDWFTSCFGTDVVLTYIGSKTRDCRMTSDKYKAHEPSTAGSWLSSAASIITGNGAADESSVLKFTDVAPYLIVSSKSMDDVWSRLPPDEKDTFDITKFRPNLIVSGAEKAWEEDYWAELSINSPDPSNSGDSAEPVKIECEHNCGRCRSINIDYATGEQGTGEAGKMLKMLSKDRRVDEGTKWSPVFGRYSFLHPRSEGRVVRVGDGVVVSRRNEGHTAFGKWALCALFESGVCADERGCRLEGVVDATWSRRRRLIGQLWAGRGLSFVLEFKRNSGVHRCTYTPPLSTACGNQARQNNALARRPGCLARRYSTRVCDKSPLLLSSFAQAISSFPSAFSPNVIKTPPSSPKVN